MSVATFIMMYNASQSGSLQPPQIPVDTDEIFYVSATGTGDGLSSANPMSVEDYEALDLPNDSTVLFKAGEEFATGGKEITTTRITFGKFGVGANPIHSGANDISGLTWTNEGSGIYSAPMVAEPNWIWISGICATNAQSARIPIVSRGSTTSITIAHAAVSGYTSIVGAYLTAKEAIFKNSQRVKVTAYNGAGVITIDGPIPTANNDDLVLMNDREFFSADNQWVWESGTLYVRAAASPSTMDIKAGVYNFGVRSTGSLTVSNIEFKEYFTASLWFNGGVPNVQDCSFHDNKDTAVLIQTAVTGAVVNNNTFARIGNNAVFTRPCTNSTFDDNTFTDIAVQGNYNFQTWFDGDGSVVVNNNQTGGCAIVYLIDLRDDSIDGANCSFEGNVCTNIGYNAVSLHVGTANFIRYNIVTGFNARLRDGAAIYNFHYRAYNIYQEDTEISYNIVSDNNGGDIANGIYCDNRTLGNYVHHNTVSDVYWGIVLNIDTKDNIVEDNNVIDCVYCYAFRSGQNGTALDEYNDGNQFNRNVAGCFLGQKAMLFDLNGSYPSWNPYTGGGADNNVYIRNAAPAANDLFDSDNQGNNLELSELRTAYGQDANSVKLLTNPAMITNPTAVTSNEDANSYYKDFSNTAIETYTIAPYYSRIVSELNQSNQFESASSRYFTIGTAADIQFTHTSIFSLVLWFKVPSIPATQIHFLDNRDATPRGIFVDITTSGFLQIQLVNTITTNRCQFHYAVNVADNNWHQLIFAKTSAVASSVVVLDGNIITTTVSNNLSATVASVEPWYIGRNAVTGTTMDGYLAEIAIYPSTQSGNRVAIYNGGRIIDLRTIGIDVPLHYWRMGLPNNLLDLGNSATPLNLTPVNAPLVSTDIP